MARFFNVPSLTSLFICGSLSVISTHVLAATVSVSDNLIISAINDKSVDNGFISKKSTFELNQGEHALVIRYKDFFEDLDFGGEIRVESQDFIVKFSITDQEQVELKTIKIKNLAAAKSFVKSPKLRLQDEHNNQLNLTLENLDEYKLAKQVDMAVNALASTKTIKTINSALAASSVITEKVSNTSIQVNSLSMLKYWWHNASTDEKQRFKQFTNAK